ncbi:Cofilin/tropomyosin-type actin-binding family protein [Candida albicans]|uniref:Cofilin/tropomyosin-type actin-binding family protein n=1 Tax=Candida albicans TaxID=5476 RepID=A0A8H6BT80_CANAX|nr:Cofilin/tropomyosin-type actin-binding family protein [Candida albicans]
MFEKLINQISQEFPHPSYIVISYNSNQYFISFIPDIAPIKQKMLYASTKNSLITSLGGNKLIKKFAWTELDELTLNYFIKSIDDDQGLTLKKKKKKN